MGGSNFLDEIRANVNRSLDLLDEQYRYEIVNVVPHLKAGGALATVAYQEFKEPVVVENVRAHAGMDIGDTFIGMHLEPVAVPVRCEIKKLARHIYQK